MSTPLNLLMGLEQRLGEIFKDFPAKLSNSQDVAKFNVYRHKVPEQLNNRVQVRGKEETQENVFPFCVVKIDNGKKPENVAKSDVQVNIFVGVENEGLAGEGYDDVLLCIQRIWNDFGENPIVANFFKVKDEHEWALNDNDDETHPYYYGLIQLSFETPSMQYNPPGGY